MRKRLRDNPVSIAFIAACADHHFPCWDSPALIGTGAKLKCLATEKARFKLLRVWHGYPRRRVRQCAPGFILLLACPMREEVDYEVPIEPGSIDAR